MSNEPCLHASGACRSGRVLPFLFCCSILLFIPFGSRAQTTLTNGAFTAGTLAANTTNTYVFDANPGDTILVRAASPIFNPSIVVRDGLGGLVASAGSGSSGARDPNITTQATNAGPYTVAISSIFAGGTGAYNINLARIAAAFVVSPGDDGGVLTNGWEYKGTNALGDMDIWTFTANAGDSIILKMGSGTINPWIRLYGPNGLQVATAGSGVSGFLSVDLQTTATNAGTYTVVTSSIFQDGFGTYTLNLAQSQSTSAVYVAPEDEGGPMTNGWEHKGFIDLGDLDVWTFNANAGDSLVLHMGATNYNPYIRLLGPDGKQVAAAGNGVSGFQNVDLAATATNGGIYTVVAGNFAGNSTGSYILNLFDSSEPVFVAPGDDGGPMTNGWKHTGNLDLGDLDGWTFNANAGDTLVLRMGATNYNPWIRLYGPDGKQVAAAGSGVSGFQNVDLTATTTNAGTYLVVVGNFAGNSTGGYLLNLAQSPEASLVAPGDEGGPITNGWKHTGNLDLGDLDMWTISANAGDSLVVRMGATNYNPYLRIFGPGGKQVGAAGSGASGFQNVEVALQATNAGTYTVVASTFSGNSTGGYILNVAQSPEPVFVAPGDEGGPITNGWKHTGTLDLGDLDVWTFSASAGDNLVFRMASANYNPLIRVYRPDGKLAGTVGNGVSGNADVSLSMQATNGGSYTVVLANFSGNAVGSYLFNMVRIPAPFFTAPGDEGGTLINGSPKSGTIDTGDMDIYRFGVCRQQTITINCQKLTGTITPRIRLYSRDGTLLATAFNSTLAAIGFTSTNSGVFTVIVDGNFVNDSGTYQLSGNGFTDELNLCQPIFVSGTNIDFAGSGGNPNGTFVLYSSTNLTTPVASWIPILTNQFDSFGAFELTNNFIPSPVHQEFFWMAEPQ